MEFLLISHTRELILKLLKLLHTAYNLTGLHQCSELPPCFFSLYDPFELLLHYIINLGTRAGDRAMARGNILQNCIHPRAHGTIHSHYHHIQPIYRVIVHGPHIMPHLGESTWTPCWRFLDYHVGASSFIYPTRIAWGQSPWSRAGNLCRFTTNNTSPPVVTEWCVDTGDVPTMGFPNILDSLCSSFLSFIGAMKTSSSWASLTLAETLAIVALL